MNWVVTVDEKHRYWVEAKDEEEARARGYRLHCASENFNASRRSAVTDCKKVG